MIIYTHSQKGNEILRREMKGGEILNEEKFFERLSDALRIHLQTPKTFIINPERARETKYALSLARKLFPDGDIVLEEDPLQLGAMILRVTDFDVVVATEMEHEQFYELISIASNFEIYPVRENKLCFAAVFEKFLLRVDT